MDQIRHDKAAHRFTLDVDGHTGYVEYEPGQDSIVITHTVVPEAIGGRGIAGRLVEAALGFAREQGLKVEPRCSYADSFMRKHPQYEDLRA